MRTCTTWTSWHKNFANNCCDKEVTGCRTTYSWLLQPVSVLPTLFHCGEVWTARRCGHAKFRLCSTSANQHSTPVSRTIARPRHSFCRACLDQQRMSVLHQLLHSKNWRRLTGKGLLKHWGVARELFFETEHLNDSKRWDSSKKGSTPASHCTSKLIWKVWEKSRGMLTGPLSCCSTRDSRWWKCLCASNIPVEDIN